MALAVWIVVALIGAGIHLKHHPAERGRTAGSRVVLIGLYLMCGRGRTLPETAPT